MKIKRLVISIVCLLIGLLAGWLICYFYYTTAGPEIVISTDFSTQSVWVRPGGTLEFASPKDFYVVEIDNGKPNRACQEPDAQLHGKAGKSIFCHINLNADDDYEFDVYPEVGPSASSTTQTVYSAVHATVQQCHPLCPNLGLSTSK